MPSRTELLRCYGTLGIYESATVEEVKKAWSAKVDIYRPTCRSNYGREDWAREKYTAVNKAQEDILDHLLGPKVPGSRGLRERELQELLGEEEFKRRGFQNTGKLQPKPKSPKFGPGPGNAAAAKLDAGTGTTCAICASDIDVGEFASVLKCGHIFHRMCLTQWTTSGCGRCSDCPVCRARIDVAHVKQVTVPVVAPAAEEPAPVTFVPGGKSILGGLKQKTHLNGQCVELRERRSDGHIIVSGLVGSPYEKDTIEVKEENLGPVLPRNFQHKFDNKEDNDSCYNGPALYFEIHGIPSDSVFFALNGRKGKWAVPSCKKPFGDCFTIVLDDGHRKTMKREHLRACMVDLD